MRKVEILRLHKRDIKFRNRKIVVQSAKNHKIRIIDIDFKLAIILFFYCRNLKDDDLLFTIKSNSVSVLFYSIMQKSNLRKITFHDLRHIHTSFLLSKLRNHANAILVVADRLGDTVTEVIITYSHVLERDKRKTIHCLNFI